MANPIVTVNVTQTIAPIPSALQKTGALISQGGTSLGIGEYSLLTQLSDLTPLLTAALALTSVAWASTFSGQVTVTATANHGVPVNEQFVTTIAGVVPAGYNGTVLATATGAATFTYYLAIDPGAQVTAGTYTPVGVGELTAMATTFFGQGYQQSVYVLELGAGTAATGVTNLGVFIADNANRFYSYLVPRKWDGVASFLAFMQQFESTTAKTYFYITSTLQNWDLYDDTQKCAIVMVEAPNVGIWATNPITGAAYSTGVVTATTTNAHGIKPGQYFQIVGFEPDTYNGTFRALPGTTGSTLLYGVPADPGSDTTQGSVVASRYASSGIPATEFSLAAPLYVALNYDPSPTNRVPPYAFAYIFGVTPFPLPGNQSLIAQLKAGSINYVGTGAEGGISNTMLLWGRTMDGRPFNYWYSVDWMQINVNLAIANAIINGSNNPINPLYYEQAGINRLEQSVASTGSRAISYGLALGSVIILELDAPDFQANLNRGDYAGNLAVNAIPFVPYARANPSDYRIGKYSGLSMVYTPLRGFEAIVFNINVTDFVAAAA